MTSKTHQFKNAMRVYAAELYAAQEFWLPDFKPMFCMYNKLRLHVEILS